ncbi:MAG: GAF domain-containing protein [Bdellovibrionales bacterium]|nr:GAF domain-containing protein [Bdellovibrionales bacterium]
MSQGGDSNSGSGSSSISLESFVPILEAPSSSETGSETLGGLLGDEVAATNTRKLALNEALLNLLPKDLAFQDFMRELLLSFQKVVPSEAGTIFELDQESNSLFFRAVSGQASDTVTKFLIPIGQGIVGFVAESRKSAKVDQVQDNARHIKAIQAAVGFSPNNLVAVPIFVRGKIYGVLELLNRIGEPNFKASDVELLEYAVSMASKVIETRLVIAWALNQNSAATEKKSA